MSSSRRQWHRGDPITATVVEVLDDREVILRFGGGPEEPDSQIMRVANETHRRLQIGDQVQLRVVEIEPLKFQYVESRSEQQRRGRLDVSI